MISMLTALITQAATALSLPEPRRDSSHSLERALVERRSVREFGATPLSLAELAQLAWAAQGVVAASGRRTTPSAGALYPLKLYSQLRPSGCYINP